MSRSCQSAMFSRPTSASARSRRARPLIRSASTGLRLCGMALLPCWPAPNGSNASADLGPLQVPDLDAIRSSVPPRMASVGQQLGVAVAAHHLGRGRVGRQAERARTRTLHLGADVGVGADRAGDLADRDPLPRARQPLRVALQLREPAGGLEAEGDRLGMDAVAAADHGGGPMLQRQPAHDLQQRAPARPPRRRSRRAGRRRWRCPARRSWSGRSAASAPPGPAAR